MQGFLVTFFTQQDRVHGQVPLAQWLLDEAKRHGIRGATMSGSMQGLGHDGAIHAAGWFDLSDQPVQVSLVVSAEESDLMFAHLEREKIRVFYMKTPVEFGMLNSDWE